MAKRISTRRKESRSKKTQKRLIAKHARLALKRKIAPQARKVRKSK